MISYIAHLHFGEGAQNPHYDPQTRSSAFFVKTCVLLKHFVFRQGIWVSHQCVLHRFVSWTHGPDKRFLSPRRPGADFLISGRRFMTGQSYKGCIYDWPVPFAKLQTCTRATFQFPIFSEVYPDFVFQKEGCVLYSSHYLCLQRGLWADVQDVLRLEGVGAPHVSGGGTALFTPTPHQPPPVHRPLHHLHHTPHLQTQLVLQLRLETLHHHKLLLWRQEILHVTENSKSVFCVQFHHQKLLWRQEILQCTLKTSIQVFPSSMLLLFFTFLDVNTQLWVKQSKPTLKIWVSVSNASVKFHH